MRFSPPPPPPRPQPRRRRPIVAVPLAGARRTRRAIGALAAASALIVTAATASGAQTAPPHGKDHRWVAAWTANPVPGSEIPWSTCPAGEGLEDRTVRNVVFLGAGGDRVRVRLTNTFGTRPLVVDGATVAVRSGGADAVPGTMRKLTFRGSHRVSVPVGEQLFSDPVRLRVKALSTLLVSVHVPGPTGPVTNHPFTAQTTYLAEGNHAPAVSGDAYGTTPCWMLTDGVDVRSAGRVTGTVVAFGDSITDTGSTTGDADQRFPDHLARRLAAVPGRTLSAVNGGLGGNRLLADREGEPYYGPSALSRMDRDVFGQTGVRAAIVLLGVNDIGYSASAEEIVGGYRKIIERGRQRGVKVYGGTLLPIHGSFVWTEERGKTWQTVNEWIRTSGEFDGVVDFAEATAAPGDPLTLHPAYDSGDHLHPNDAGTRAMAEAVDLAMLLGGEKPGGRPGR